MIPMSGYGERFKRAGYSVPKPLIEVEGKPVIAHVLEMFPGEKDVLFVCNQEHLEESSYALEKTLKTYCPTGTVVGIAPHKKGPVHAVCEVASWLQKDEPVVVNYCDFTCYWDWDHFKDFVKRTGCVGALPAYKGFHPHSLGSTQYAYMREDKGWVLDIQEKQPYTSKRMEEYASSGTYYFNSTHTMMEAMHATMKQGLHVGGEYYVSLVYKMLLQQKHPVAVYPLQHFMQWGTPEDLEEYRVWSGMFKRLVSLPLPSNIPQGACVMPMAGLGQRFVDEGYAAVKPLVEVSGEAMVLQAMKNAPAAHQRVCVVRQDMPHLENVLNTLQHMQPESEVVVLPGVTEGQACTAYAGIQTLGDWKESITAVACDNGCLYASEAWQACLQRTDVDVWVWGVRGYPNAVRNPHMYGWIEEKQGGVQRISVKKPLLQPAQDPVVVGTFVFKNIEIFQKSYQRLKARNGRVNGEFYIDSMINDAVELGYTCALFEVEYEMCWGTPNDVRTYAYWQSCFHKWHAHPYCLEKDVRVPEQALKKLECLYQKTFPQDPVPQEEVYGC